LVDNLPMPTFETIAAQLARCVDLVRDPGAKQLQDTELQALVELLKETPVTIAARAGRLEVNGVPCEGAGLGELVQRLDVHRVAEITFPQDPPPAQLLTLLQALADPPATDDLPAWLRASGADQVRVSITTVTPPAASAAPDDFGSAAPVMPSPEAAEHRSGALGTDGILRGEALRDIASVYLPEVPLITHDQQRPPAAVALPGEPGAGPAAAPLEPLEVERDASVTLGAPGPQSGSVNAGDVRQDITIDPGLPPETAPPPRATSPPEVPPSGLPPATAHADAAPAEAAILPPLVELERNPGAPNVDNLLAGLVRKVEAMVKSEPAEQLLPIILTIVRNEQRVPEGSSARRHYGITLRRIYSKAVLRALAQLVTTPRRAEAMVALQRARDDAVEVLFDALVAAPTVGERRAVFDALTQMTQGTEQLVHVLDHPEWFVVRNVAELLGELGMEDAVPALSRQLDHPNERVRKAVALALAKIGTRSTAEPLRRALRDKSPDVRVQVALGIGGRKSIALAMPLVVAMEDEKDEAVARELILALGRIGSPDAVQALIKYSQPASRLFGRKAPERRIAAVEALRTVATGPAIGTLQGLADDGDKDVRAAARAALADLESKRRG
jgi:HEAT repeat protein